MQLLNNVVSNTIYFLFKIIISVLIVEIFCSSKMVVLNVDTENQHQIFSESEENCY
jgi:hypothetical protein